MPLSKSMPTLLNILILGIVVLMQGCADRGNPPVLRLIGNDTVSTFHGSAYDDRGVIAFDREDLDITDKVVVSQPININVPGFQQQVYSVTDRHGNTTEIGRTVQITASSVSLDGNFTAKSNGFNCATNGSTVRLSPYLGRADQVLISPVFGTGNSTLVMQIEENNGLSYVSGTDIPCNLTIYQANGYISANADSMVVLIYGNSQPIGYSTLVYLRQ